LPPPQSEENISRLKEVSDNWLKHQQGGEKRFSLGWFSPGYLRHCPVMIVKDENGTIRAFANLIPEYQRNEGTIDLMRRREGDVGLIDLLFVRLIEYFQTQHYDTFNLGLCPLAGVGEEQNASVQEKVVRLFYHHFNQLYNFKGLRKFKEKFTPSWEPRYLIYSNSLALPKITLAIVKANAGGSLRSYLESWREKKRLVK
ncbi:MAG TPA: phosphatidylglycerol lysyltransferase domain-containing protein, partial [Syntrophomonadaceae bacterium]|nr:phosphatidylglycerol lysyltransferase domain-containing protein [Syntrophomonadaceae bacterium]